MEFLGNYNLNEQITFTVNTHNLVTGSSVDADAVPSYRVYENTSGTPVLTGNMSLFDSVNTNGFYVASFYATTANNFENNKNYTIYISATVGGVVGTVNQQFRVGSYNMIQKDLSIYSISLEDGEIGSGSIANTYSIDGSSLMLTAVDDYLNIGFNFDVSDNMIPVSLTIRAQNLGSAQDIFNPDDTVVGNLILPTMTTQVINLDGTEGFSYFVIKNQDGFPDEYIDLRIDYVKLTVLERYDPIFDKNFSEPVQGTPLATDNLATKVNYLYKSWRNKVEQTNTVYKLFNNDDTTVDQKATVSDNGTAFTREEVTSGP